MALLAPRRLAAPLLLSLVVGCHPERATTSIPAQALGGGGGGEGEAPLCYDAEDRLAAPAGQWAMLSEDHHCLTVLGETIENVVWNWYRVDIEVLGSPGDPATGNAPRFLRETVQLCRQEISPVLLGLRTNIPQAIPEALSPGVVDSTVIGEEAGAPYVSGLQLDLWGIRGVGEDDELPGDGDDPRVFDLDGDGHPGATVTLGDGGCDIYIIQRTSARRSGVVHDAARIEGTFVGDLTQRVLHASTALCASENTISDGGRPSRFALLRVDGRAGSPDLDGDADGRVSCGELLAAADPLLASVGFGLQERDDEVCADR